MSQAALINVVVPLWRRRLLSDAVLAYYDRMIAGAALASDGLGHLRLAFTLVYSPDEDGEYTRLCPPSMPRAEALGLVQVIEYENSPVSDKWNAAAVAAMRRWPGAAGLCVVGSDDLVSEGYFVKAAGLIEEGAHLVRPRAIHFYDLPTGRAFYCAPRYIGCAAILSPHTLLRCCGRPWPDGLNTGIDAFFSRRMKSFGVHTERQVDCPIVREKGNGAIIMDIKCRAENDRGELEQLNIHSYEMIRSALSKAASEVCGAHLLERFDGMERELLRVRGRLLGKATASAT